jgi:hypothetical protein
MVAAKLYGELAGILALAGNEGRTDPFRTGATLIGSGGGT